LSTPLRKNIFIQTCFLKIPVIYTSNLPGHSLSREIFVYFSAKIATATRASNPLLPSEFFFVSTIATLYKQRLRFPHSVISLARPSLRSSRIRLPPEKIIGGSAQWFMAPDRMNRELFVNPVRGGGSQKSKGVIQGRHKLFQ